MSLKKVESVKKDRGFKLADLIIYAVIALAVLSLFLAVFLTRNDSPLKGVRIFIEDKEVFVCDFESSEYSVSDERATVVEGQTLEVKITVNSGYNIVSIDMSARTAKVTEADCRGRDCVHTPEIKDSGGIIYCSPHSVRVEPFGYEPDNSVIV